MPGHRFLVALAAFLVAPLSFATAGFMLFAAGFGAILLADYSPPERRLTLPPVAANVPEAKRIRIVCGGAAISTLGGHFPLDRPLDPDDWP